MLYQRLETAAKRQTLDEQWAWLYAKLSKYFNGDCFGLRLEFHVPVEQDDAATGGKGAAWLALRKDCHFISASTAGRMAGLCDYTSRNQAYEIALGLKPDPCANPTTFLAQQLDRGRLNEPLIRDEVVLASGLTFFPQGSYQRGAFLASPDGLLMNKEGTEMYTFEIKSPGNIEKMERLIPTGYLVQMHVQMFCMGLTDALFAASSDPGRNLVVWKVEYNVDAMKFISDELAAFAQFVMSRTPPPRDTDKAERIARFRSLIKMERLI